MKVTYAERDYLDTCLEQQIGAHPGADSKLAEAYARVLADRAPNAEQEVSEGIRAAQGLLTWITSYEQTLTGRSDAIRGLVTGILGHLMRAQQALEDEK